VNAEADVLLIFDCCFSFLASRCTNATSRVVEILTAAEGPADPSAFQAGKKAAFTMKFMLEVRRRVREGHKSIEIADVMSKIRRTSPRKIPGYTPRLGSGSITLPPCSATRTPGIEHSPPKPSLLATFSIHVSCTLNNEQLKAISAWIQDLDGEHKMTLEGVKMTDSMGFIFEGHRLCFLRILLEGLRVLGQFEKTSWLNASG
jgi:hypothetical protein